MNKKNFDFLLNKFQHGDQQLLKTVFQKYKSSCEKKLCYKLKCGDDYAKDLYMEAILIFRKEALKGNVSFINLEGYLYKIAYRVFLRNEAKKRLIEKNPLLKDDSTNMDEIPDDRLKALNQSWSEISDNCKNLLKDFYYDGHKLMDLQKKYNYASYDTIKTTKKRCLARLRALTKAYYSKFSQSKHMTL